jgi:hypothetical protein
MSTYSNQPQEIFNKDPHVNLDTVEYNALRKGYFPKQDGLFICLKCEWVQKTKDKCEKCSAPNFRMVNKRTQVHPPSKGSVAHYMRKVTMCWNGEADPDNRDLIKYHPYDEKTRLVVNLSTQEAHQETYCASCGRVYGWPSGRTATPEEMEKCRKGEIPHKTTKPVASEIDSA